MKANCMYCSKEFEITTSHYNRAMKFGRSIYCSKAHSGLARRTSKEEKVRLKSEYDKVYRAKNKERKKKLAAEYFQRTYVPEKARIERKKNMQRHIEYCRKPEYKKWKEEYDKVYRAKKIYGEFWESFLILMKIEDSIDKRETRFSNNLHNKSQKRKRQWKSLQQTD